jgi:hypothetical protein
MASRRQERLGRYLDSTRSLQVGEEERELALHGGASEREAFARRTNMGDRQSDALARQIAIATPIATAAALMLATDSPASSKSSAPASRTNQAFSDEVNRQIATNKQSTISAQNPNIDDYSLFLDPNETGIVVLGPLNLVKNPHISLYTGWNYNDFKVVGVSQNNKAILPGASIDSFKKGLIFPGSVDKDNPIKITVSYTGKYRGYIQGRLRP